MKLVSIILYVFNGEKYLAEAVNSCLSQDYTNLEVIIVDDASTDKTREVIQGFSDPRVKSISNKRIRGKAESWNSGISQSRGDYLMPISYAEKLDPAAVCELMRLIESSVDCEFAYSDYSMFHAVSRRAEEIKLPVYEDILNMYRISPCYLFSRKVYESIGKFDRKFEPVSGYAFWLKVIERFKLLHCRKSMVTVFSFPGKTNFKDLSQMSLMEDLARYCTGNGALSRIFRPTEIFLKHLWRSKRGLFSLMKVTVETFLKLCGLAPHIGLYFTIILSVQVIRRILRPCVSHFKKAVLKFRLQATRSAYAKDPAKIDVLCLIPELVVGGSEKVVGDIVGGLTDKGYRFHLLGSQGENNAWCRSLSRLFSSIFLLPESLRDPDERNRSEYYFYASNIIRHLNIKMILVSNSYQGYEALSQFKSEFPDIKIIDLLHVERYAGTTDDALQYVPLLDRRICISNYLKEHMLQKYQKVNINGEFSSRMAVIYNGNDMDEFNPEKVKRGAFRKKYGLRPETKIISYIGRISPEKRPFLVVDIARQVFAESPNLDCRFVIAGDGPEFKSLKKKIVDHKFADKIITTGMIGKTEIKELFADSFAAVIVSHIEGLPLVLVEAMAMNVPVITTDVGAVKEVITNGVNGYVVSSQENVIENFSEIIQDLAADSGKYSQVSSNLRNSIVSRFSLTKMVQEYGQVFSDVMSNDRSSNGPESIRIIKET